MVFAVRIAKGIEGPEDWRPLKQGNRKRLQEHMGQSQFDVERKGVCFSRDKRYGRRQTHEK